MNKKLLFPTIFMAFNAAIALPANRFIEVNDPQKLKSILTLCFESHYDEAIKLLRRRLNSSPIDEDGNNIIYQALVRHNEACDTENFIEILKLLFRHVDANHVNNKEQTLFHLACKQDLGEKTDAVLFLILRRIDSNELEEFMTKVDSFGCTAYDYACAHSSVKAFFSIQSESGVCASSIQIVFS